LSPAAAVAVAPAAAVAVAPVVAVGSQGSTFCLIHAPPHTPKNELAQFTPVFRISISLHPDPDPGFYLSADPDPDSGFWILIQGLFCPKIKIYGSFLMSSFSCTLFAFGFIILKN